MSSLSVISTIKHIKADDPKKRYGVHCLANSLNSALTL